MKNLQYYKDLGVFDDDQLFQIEEGLEVGLDASIYANPEFSVDQMEEIRLDLEESLELMSLF